MALAPATGQAKAPHGVEHACYLTPARDEPDRDGYEVWVCQPTVGVRTSKPRGWQPCWRVEEKARASKATSGLSHWQNNTKKANLQAELLGQDQYATLTEAQEEI